MVTSDSKTTGRSRTGDVRQRILEAAASEFSARGFAGGRVDRIAARARVNKRMIYHYFGHKRGLRQAVLERWLPVAGPEELLERPPHPLAARLLLWTLLEAGEQGRAPGPLAAVAGLRERLASAQRAHRLPPELDVARLADLLAWGSALLAVSGGEPGEQSGGHVLRDLLDALAMPRQNTTPTHKPRIRLKPRGR